MLNKFKFKSCKTVILFLMLTLTIVCIFAVANYLHRHPSTSQKHSEKIALAYLRSHKSLILQPQKIAPIVAKTS